MREVILLPTWSVFCSVLYRLYSFLSLYSLCRYGKHTDASWYLVNHKIRHREGDQQLRKKVEDRVADPEVINKNEITERKMNAWQSDEFIFWDGSGRLWGAITTILKVQCRRITDDGWMDSLLSQLWRTAGKVLPRRPSAQWQDGKMKNGERKKWNEIGNKLESIKLEWKKGIKRV